MMRKIVHSFLGIESEPTVNASPRKSCKSNLQLVEEQGKLRNSAERVDFVLRNVDVGLSDKGESGKKLRKNSTVARALRERGNAFYKKGELANALECYNVAIMFAPNLHQELGLAYANRSAVLVELGHPEESLTDIELAGLNNYPKPAVLESRTRRCNEMIEQRNETQGDEQRNLRIKVEVERRKRQNMREEMLKIENPNPRTPEVAEFLRIEYDEAMGRRLVVNRDVPAGTVLSVSYPYATTMRWNGGWNSERCHYCLKRIRRGIPCENCVFAFYCTQSCKQRALEEYHKYECPCLDFPHWQDAHFTALPLRTVCKAGPRKLYQLFQTQDPAYFNPKAPYGTDEGCKFNEDPYLAVYHMETHTEKLYEPIEVHAKRTFSAVILASYLEARSAFFEEIPKSQRTDFKKFVATLIRHHIDALIINPSGVADICGLEGISAAEFYGNEELSPLTSHSRSKLEAFASGMYPMNSLVSHGCHVNTHTIDDMTEGRGRKIMFAAHALKAGDVLYGRYHVVFTEHPLEYRQQYLKNRYYFTCQCVACVYKWPLMAPASRAGFFPSSADFCCPNCSSKYSMIEKASADFRKNCGLNEAGSWKCTSCARQYTGDALLRLNAANMTTVGEASQLIQSNRPREAIPKLLKVIEFLQTHTCPPPYFQIHVENNLCHALGLLFHSLPGE